jgi:hypothetical protein
MAFLKHETGNSPAGLVMSGELINEFIVFIKGFYQSLMGERLLSALYNENNGTSGYDFVLWHFKKRLV